MFMVHPSHTCMLVSEQTALCRPLVMKEEWSLYQTCHWLFYEQRVSKYIILIEHIIRSYSLHILLIIDIRINGQHNQECSKENLELVRVSQTTQNSLKEIHKRTIYLSATVLYALLSVTSVQPINDPSVWGVARARYAWWEIDTVLLPRKCLKYILYTSLCLWIMEYNKSLRMNVVKSSQRDNAVNLNSNEK